MAKQLVITMNAIVNLYLRGMSRDEISEALGVDAGMVGKKIGSYKASLSQHRKAEERAEKMLELRNKGMTNSEIARALVTTPTTVIARIGKQPKELVRISRKIGAQKARLTKVSRLMRRAMMMPADMPARQVQVSAD